MGTGSFPGGKKQPGRDADTSPPSSAVVMKEYSYTSTPPMGCTAYTETHCLYKGALYLYLYLVSSVITNTVWPVGTMCTSLRVVSDPHTKLF